MKGTAFPLKWWEFDANDFASQILWNNLPHGYRPSPGVKK
jgi:hypothetical protein